MKLERTTNRSSPISAVLMILSVLVLASVVPADTTINFSTLQDKKWVFCGVEPGHVYGYSEVPWVYDPYHKKFLRFGGCTGGYTNEIYAYSFDQSGNFVSEEILPPGTQGGDNRVGAGCSRGVCYDSKRHIVWGYGGIGSPPIPCSGKNWDLMGLDLSDKSWRTAPNSNKYFGATTQIDYSERHDAILMVTDGTGWHQCWLYEFSKSAWRQIGTEWALTTAGPRQGISMNYKEVCYDPDNHVFVMYPGPSSAPQTWVFNPATMTDWEVRRPDPTPPARERYGLAWDSRNHKMVLHGGWQGSWEDRITMTDTWIYDAAANIWTKIPDAGASRTAGGQTNMTAFDYDSEHNAFVAMCTNGERGTWIFRLGNATGAELGKLIPQPVDWIVFPNPFFTKARLRFLFGTEHAATVPDQVRICSVDGRLLESLRLARSGNGYAAEWTAGGAWSGYCIVKVKIGGREYSKKILRMR